MGARRGRVCFTRQATASRPVSEEIAVAGMGREQLSNVVFRGSDRAASYCSTFRSES